MIVIVMGVSGSGKTTVRALVAAALGCRFQDADELHSPANIAKMRSGESLTDADRGPWLSTIAAEIDRWRANGVCGLVACSVLKRRYRDVLIGARSDVSLVYLKGSRELIRERMAARHGHFMPVGLLESQFEALEEPTPDEHPLVVDICGAPLETANKVLRQLKVRS